MTVSASIRTCAYVAELSGRDLRGQLPLLLSLLLLSEFELDEDLVDLVDLLEFDFDDLVAVVVGVVLGFGATRTGVRTGAIRRAVGFGGATTGGGGGGGAAIGGTNGCTDDEPASDTGAGG
ncbi:MAG: hypothetical protein QOG57_7165, partial [Pseudonocardiales bacterium]|nr:hypothetical protein [Pseudonocardiales bacterium]